LYDYFPASLRLVCSLAQRLFLRLTHSPNLAQLQLGDGLTSISFQWHLDSLSKLTHSPDQWTANHLAHRQPIRNCPLPVVWVSLVVLGSMHVWFWNPVRIRQLREHGRAGRESPAPVVLQQIWRRRN
jgi:hypothetical protein